MDKKDDDQVVATVTAEQAQKSKAALKQPRWPGLGGNNSGLKNSKSVQARMPIGRGSARGR